MYALKTFIDGETKSLRDYDSAVRDAFTTFNQERTLDNKNALAELLDTCLIQHNRVMILISAEDSIKGKPYQKDLLVSFANNVLRVAADKIRDGNQANVSEILAASDLLNITNSL